MDSESSRCNEVMFALRRIIRAMDIHSRNLARRHGLTWPQSIALKELNKIGEMPVGRLAQAMSLSPATATDILDRLEKRTLVKRSRTDPADRRRVLVSITEKGREVCEGIPNLLQEKFVAKFSEIQDWEQTLVLSSIQRIASLMELDSLGSEENPITLDDIASAAK